MLFLCRKIRYLNINLNIRMRNIQILTLILSVTFVLSLRISTNHLQQEFESFQQLTLTDMFNSAPPQEKKLVKKILKAEDKDLFKSLKKGTLSDQESQRVIDILLEDDEFYGKISSEITSDPQAQWIADLNEADQKATIKAFMNIKNPSDMAEAILTNDATREGFINNMAQQDPTFEAVKDLSKEKQEKLIRALMSGNIFEILLDSDLAPIFMPSDAQAHLLGSKAKHQVNVLKHALINHAKA